MFLKIIKLDDTIFQKALDFFGEDFCKKLKKEKTGTFRESLVARYFLFPLLCKEGARGWSQGAEDPCYSSISHKKDLIFIWVSENKIWVDIEIVKQRDISILEKFTSDEYEKLSQQGPLGPCNKWTHFYTLWTAKEAIIKYETLLLDDMEDIILYSVDMFCKNISWVNFFNKLLFQYKNKLFTIYNWHKKNIAFSVCISDKIW